MKNCWVKDFWGAVYGIPAVWKYHPIDYELQIDNYRLLIIEGKYAFIMQREFGINSSGMAWKLCLLMEGSRQYTMPAMLCSYQKCLTLIYSWENEWILKCGMFLRTPGLDVQSHEE